MINFMAELFKKTEILINAAPSNNVARQYNVYEFDMKPLQENSYWLEWGGFDDLNYPEIIRLYYGEFLKPVSSISDVEKVSYSYFIENNIYYREPLKTLDNVRRKCFT